jgi:hypothetical protein
MYPLNSGKGTLAFPGRAFPEREGLRYGNTQ